MNNKFDPYTRFHGKIDVSKIVPGYEPIIERRHKTGQKRLTSAHQRKEEMIVPNLLTGEQQKRENPLPKEYKSILEVSTRCPYCVVKGTTVLVPPTTDKKTGRITAGFKTKKIEDLKVGDLLSGYDVETEGIVVNKIKEILRRESKTVKVYLNNCSKRLLHCSEDHPIFTSHGWKKAKDLTTQDEVFYYFEKPKMRTKENPIHRPEVRKKPVLKVEESGIEEVYNFELDGTNTYFANGFLSHNCPISLVLDVSGGFCSYACRYCFQAKSIESLMTSFFDSDNPMQLRWASQEHVKKHLTEILRSRGVEPAERESMRGKCGSINDPHTLKKAVAQRVPLRFGTRSENFLPPERKLKVSLEALKIVKDFDYPLIINTKSEILAEEPWFKTICELGNNVAIQESITHVDDKFSKLLEPGAPLASKRWDVLKQFNDVGINAMVRMEPCAHFLNADDEHLKAYMDKAKECGVKNFMGDVYHYTANHEEIQNLFYEMGVDFARMWEATSEYQGLGSLSFEKAMYYAKKQGIRCGTFNYHSVPWNDDPVCCMVGKQFGSWSKYSIIHALRNEFAEHPNTNISFTDFDEKYYGLELHPSIRERIREVWNMDKMNCFTLDFMEGMVPVDLDSEENLVWRFEPERMGEIYDSIIKMFGGN